MVISLLTGGVRSVLRFFLNGVRQADPVASVPLAEETSVLAN